MKNLLIYGLALVFLVACDSEPTFVDNGNPGQIRAIVFYDDNKNGALDSNETGAPLGVAISQEVSCPPSSAPSFVQTDANGESFFTDLKPGKYCVFVDNNSGMTTKLTQEVYVSSDEVTTIVFGLVRE